MNGLTIMLLHDEAKEELKGKKIKNATFLIKSKFSRAKLHQYDKNTCKDLPPNMKETRNFAKIQIVRHKIVWSCETKSNITMPNMSA